MRRWAWRAEAGCCRGERRRLEAWHCRHMGARCERSGRLGRSGSGGAKRGGVVGRGGEREAKSVGGERGVLLE
jgi:hypothetical protein